MRVTLVETASSDSKGSMRRYADLVELAFKGQSDVIIDRKSLLATRRPRPWHVGPLGTLAHHAAVYHGARRLAACSTSDLFHLIDGSHGYTVPSLSAKPTVVTVHDIIPVLQSSGTFATPAPGLGARCVIQRAVAGLKTARHLICDSHSTKRDLTQQLRDVAERSTVIYPPVEPGFLLDGVEERDSARQRIIVHIGNNAFYKNREGVIRIFAATGLASSHRLVMAGPPPTEQQRQLARDLGVLDQIDFVIDPTNEKVRSLYRTAQLLLFPSVYEGFGWPPLEAMASGCPVVCSHSGSLPEVVGDAALTARHHDIAAMAKNCCEIIKDHDLRARLIRTGRERARLFSIAAFREQLSAIYRNVLQSSGGHLLDSQLNRTREAINPDSKDLAPR